MMLDEVNKILGTKYTYLDWVIISEYNCLTEDFIRKYKDYVIWRSISQSQKLSIDFIKEFEDYVYWGILLRYMSFPEESLRIFHERFTGIWSVVSFFQILSEEFIIDFNDKLHWNALSSENYSNLSYSTIHMFKHKVNWRLLNNLGITEKLVNNFILLDSI